ncbi:MAG: phosphoglycerate kinase [Clostridia bacterium]|nr:phosphoglycerate kinase [Clostridia bacterium]
MAKKSIMDVIVKDKRCLVRVDFNVPMDEQGNITSDNRIVATLPTINYLIEQGAKVILMSHLGRPKGRVNLEFTLKPVADRLSQLINRPVIFATDSIGPSAKATTSNMQSGQVVLLENLRFYPEEEANDEQFCRQLASMCDIYVNDAFGTAHRAHASTAGISKFCTTSVCGLLIEKELSIMGKALENPDRPLVAILGGSKVSDKIGVINNLIGKVDTLLIGGAMAYTFYKAMGYTVGNSLCEDDKVQLATELMAKAKQHRVELVLPVDNVCADNIDNPTSIIECSRNSIPDSYMGLDIGSKTIQVFSQYISKAKTIIWNGPLGVFEKEQFAKGTYCVAKAVVESGAVSIIGGGDSASAINKMGFADKVTHISTGGGASLEYLEGLVLPGIDCLDDK